jgi:hypothetical protein
MVLRERKEEHNEIFGIEEAMAKVNLELMNPIGNKLKTLSDVTPAEVFGISVLNIYQNLFDSKVIKDWIEDFLQLRISRLRLGRREFVSLGTGMSEYAHEKKRGSKGGDLFAGLKS